MRQTVLCEELSSLMWPGYVKTVMELSCTTNTLRELALYVCCVCLLCMFGRSSNLMYGYNAVPGYVCKGFTVLEEAVLSDST